MHHSKLLVYTAFVFRQQFATARKAMSDRKACDVKEPLCTPLGERTNIAPSNAAAKAKPNPNQLLRSQSVAQPTNTRMPHLQKEQCLPIELAQHFLQVRRPCIAHLLILFM